MADIKVWYILTNKDFQPFAEPHSETFSHNRTVQVDDLKKAIIGSTKPTHFLSDVAPAELEVFTSSSLRVSDGDTFEKLEKLLNGIDKSKLEHLHPMQVPSSDQIYLVRVSKSHVSAKRKPEPEDTYLQRLKSRKLASTTPHTLNKPSVYALLQKSEAERILDDCPAPNTVIPPLVLLYRGFGQFIDSTRRAAIEPGTFSDPEISDLKEDVDKLMDAMCEVDDNELRKQEKAKGPLLRILFPGTTTNFSHRIKDDQNSALTDGHILSSHGVPLLIVEFKRAIDMAEPQVAAYFVRLAIEAGEKVGRGWRLPILGLIIRGSQISFFGLVMVDTQVRMLPITPSFPCNDSVLCRAPVYVAFSAAKVLLETIRKDAEEFINLSLPADIQFKHPFPYVQYLRQFHANDCQQKGQLGFQITETFDRDVTNRFLYVAKVTSGPESGTILVKFTTKYSKELHHFCASSGFAPKLFAFEELPGGWFGIAMEYFPSALRIAESPGLVDHGDAWLTKMDEIVEKFHKNGYVHGDLRPPNFIADGERLLLIDFDWGGKEGEATFPDTRILPVLRKDRGDMLIKRHHDTNVLAYTKQEIRKIMGRTLERC